jgi:hypothetical protein
MATHNPATRKSSRVRHVVLVVDNDERLHTMNPVAVNSEMSLEFDLDGRLISAGSVVIYNCQTGCGPDTETGVGLRFTDISSKDRSFISEFVKNEVMKGITSEGSW